MVKTLEKTLKIGGGGNAGGNMSDEVATQLAAWAKVYGRTDRLCRHLLKQHRNA